MSKHSVNHKYIFKNKDNVCYLHMHVHAINTAIAIIMAPTENVELAPLLGSSVAVVVTVVVVVVVLVVVVVVVVLVVVVSQPTWNAPGHLPSSAPHCHFQVSSVAA